MKFSRLAHYFDLIENTPSRLEMTRHLAKLFTEASALEIGPILYLLQGRIVPLYVTAEFNMGEKMVIQAAAQAMGQEKGTFEMLFKKHGDIGSAIEELKQYQASLISHDLSVLEVCSKLRAIVEASGPGSVEKKVSLLSSLIQDLDSLSCRYVVRIPINKLRLGFSDMTILDAFSWMLKQDKSMRGVIEKAYHVRPDIGFIGELLKKHKGKGLENVTPAIFTPILMMRAERLSDPSQIFEKSKNGFIEPKYDGFRLQAHGKDGVVKLFSRSLEDVTHMYPDVAGAVLHELKFKDIIFEGEAIGFNPKTGKLLPFQETVQRKRKYDIEEKIKEIPLKFFAFDLLFLNGSSRLETPLEERRSQLTDLIKNTKTATVNLAPEVRVTSVEIVKKQFEKSIRDNLEGIMIKKHDGTYQPNARNWNWIKYKKSYASRVDDTIDCLVMGYDSGQGKRSGFGIGALLVGVYDAESDDFKTVCKIGTGLTDEEWKLIRVMCDKFKTPKKPIQYDVDKMMNVDVWVKPSIVLEIRSDEITRSPTHTAGRVLQKTKSGGGMEVKTAGFALRFPRLEKLREDKRPDDVTTVLEVASLFNLQNK